MQIAFACGLSGASPRRRRTPWRVLAPVERARRPSQTLPDHPAAGPRRRLDPTAPFKWADLGGGVGQLLTLHCCLPGRLLLVASYHLDVSTVSRGRGQSAVAGAAYRAGETLHCEREGVTHDYSRKGGVETAFVLAPDGAPSWASERNALWNAAEAAEGRKNSVVAREWRLALPYELSSEKRIVLAEGFGRELVARYGIAVDVAVHAPHLEGDDRNWHAHLLTTTRELGSDGFGAKTRVLDAAKTGSVEIVAMRAAWAEAQNEAYREAGIDASVDHRSFEAQREEALEKDDEVAAALLERIPEPRMGVAATNMERKAKREALADGRDYEPVTERGRAMEVIRELRGELERAVSGVAALRDRVVGAYGAARKAGASWVGAALEALKAVEAGPGAGKDLGEASRVERRPGPSGVAAAPSGEREQVAKGRDGSEVGDLFAALKAVERGAGDSGGDGDRSSSADRAEQRIAEIQQEREDEKQRLAEQEKQEQQKAERGDEDEELVRDRAPRETKLERETREREIQPSKDRGWDMER